MWTASARAVLRKVPPSVSDKRGNCVGNMVNVIYNSTRYPKESLNVLGSLKT